ncbi:hypothetical protein [Pedobacter miscanthi]|uniref:hypothetical protein n=1 Tax=Pedobacter miscanthi TaxID=2259170 RepID=UPI0029318377|nr:hypothetical protein [Pedobacter miscanthi]
MKTLKNWILEFKAIFPIFMSLLLLTGTSSILNAQTLYVDALKGKAGSTGSKNHPLASLEEAINKTNSFTGLEAIHIKLAPGNYILQNRMHIRTMLSETDTISYTIEATIIPQSKGWKESKMPVISSISDNNISTPLVCAVGFDVEKHNVNFVGLKFTGNSNANNTAYYPIRRSDPKLTGLEISYCDFIGKKEGSPIEGSLWLTGKGISINHCSFFQSKTAIILFGTFNEFSLKNTLIQGSYEAAIWCAGYGTPFNFSNNKINNCRYVMVHPEKMQKLFTFNNSDFEGNENYIGAYGAAKDKQVPIVKPTAGENVKEVNVKKH